MARNKGNRRPHELAGKKVTILSGELAGQEIVIEDWFENIRGQSWRDSIGSFAAVQYAVRGHADRLPMDDEAIYGHIGALGYIVHQSEIVQPVAAAVAA